ncbi:ATP-binding protein [Peterkaempfera bronchialis]|uniref:ATP-binding protein n=1 Tax=Peterkaempfera bronchialis TaxID=2126346 RepID=UPI000DAE900D|nr:ATP-binding protein [Peterkaempfera bronchialis]
MELTETFDGRPGTTALARNAAAMFVRTVEGATGRRADAAGTDALLLVVSELVANACRHAPGPCSLRLGWRPGRLEVAVADACEAEPAGRRPDLVAGTGGFGWPLVSRLAESVRISHPAEGGKCIQVSLPAW